MEIKVRYFSKFGRTERIARAIAEGAGVTAVSLLDEKAPQGSCDVLFLGGAPYANVMAPELRAYAEALTKESVGQVVLFTTACWSHRTVKGLKKILQEKGIPVAEEYFFAQMLRVKDREPDARAFAEKTVRNLSPEQE